MLSRNAIQAHIGREGLKVVKWRTWSEAVEKEGTPLLRESRPSGYSDWFVVINGQSIWWVYSDTSGGGIWTSVGLAITGFRVPYDEAIAQSIYQLVYEKMMTGK